MGGLRRVRVGDCHAVVAVLLRTEKIDRMVNWFCCCKTLLAGRKMVEGFFSSGDARRSGPRWWWRLVIGTRNGFLRQSVQQQRQRSLQQKDSLFFSSTHYVMVAMFYHGSLQEGIALAVSQSKAVICFVRGTLYPRNFTSYWTAVAMWKAQELLISHGLLRAYRLTYCGLQ